MVQQFEIVSPGAADDDVIAASIYADTPVPRVGDEVAISGYGRLVVQRVVWDVFSAGFCDTVHVVCGAL